ncbi:tetratricopeptide repeat-containing sulfotransferase family protein [Puniceibacterium sediminis]|uniref:Sulfotransferase family protein n=1 Tax=Puniceibacterium sediminis TaxID=1608407 RepID=A0A238Y3R0_9RHOB|nr:sulfotransferase [Puniceibacterium sediminis]SNR65612.1 Sulfotransferase family protein [Puniceibacterium sediminis]
MLPPLSNDQIKARYNAALHLLNTGKTDQARIALEQLNALRPGTAEVLFQLSRIAHMDGDHAARAGYLAQALQVKPDEPTLIEAQIAAQTALSDHEAVLALYDHLIALDPKSIAHKADKGSYLQRIGHFDQAEALFRKLIKKHPDQGSLYRVFLGGIKLPAKDPMMRSMIRALADPRLTDHNRMHLSFALAKAAEDQGETAKVFGHLNRANRIQRKLAPFDRAARSAETDAFLHAQEAADYTPVDAEMPLRPVFVTGMPRSGTTLVEQIIAAHSGVTGGGELAHALSLIVRGFATTTGITALSAIPDTRLAQLAQDYAALARRDTGAATGVITDKSIQNYLIYGYLHRAMPGARFIVVHRDPRDIALSIYKNYFALGRHTYANDLSDIAFMIKEFRRVIAHWKTRLPGVIHEIHYDHLVADPEPQARALIAAAGLEWEDGCLDFHKAKGTVKTLSLHQVRQPIYRGSAQAWRKYETELAPFIAAWGDEPWD